MANDGAADSNVATVSLTVTPVNDAPVAVADAYSTAEDTPLTIAAPGVLGNDTDVEGSPLTAVLTVRPGHGSLTLTRMAPSPTRRTSTTTGPTSSPTWRMTAPRLAAQRQ